MLNGSRLSVHIQDRNLPHYHHRSKEGALYAMLTTLFILDDGTVAETLNDRWKPVDITALVLPKDTGRLLLIELVRKLFRTSCYPICRALSECRTQLSQAQEQGSAFGYSDACRHGYRAYGLTERGEHKSVIVNVGPGWHKIYNSCDFGEVFPSSVSSLNKRQRQGHRPTIISPSHKTPCLQRP